MNNRAIEISELTNEGRLTLVNALNVLGYVTIRVTDGTDNWEDRELHMFDSPNMTIRFFEEVRPLSKEDVQKWDKKQFPAWQKSIRLFMGEEGLSKLDLLQAEVMADALHQALEALPSSALSLSEWRAEAYEYGRIMGVKESSDEAELRLSDMVRSYGPTPYRESWQHQSTLLKYINTYIAPFTTRTFVF